MTLLLVAFATFFAVEVAKTIGLRWGRPTAEVKLMAVLATALLAAWFVTGDTDNHTAVLALGGAGVAALVHKAHRWLSAAGDGHLLAASSMATRRPR